MFLALQYIPNKRRFTGYNLDDDRNYHCRAEFDCVTDLLTSMISVNFSDFVCIG